MNALAPNPDQAMSPFQQIAALRQERGESLAEFAAAVGCSSKGRMSEIERGRASPTVAQALRLEQLSDGRIDAATLNDDVRAARAGPAQLADAPDAFTEARVVVCDVCQHRVDGGVRNACTFVDCPHGARGGLGEAA
jgi:transcriptional regulator with XRE-family HTH domain